MANNITAELISIGTEILLGELTDTNSVFLARTLRDLGINVYFMTSVGDNQQRISDAIQLGLQRADIVITCGGLGPTVDDMTRESVAAATGRGLTFHPALLEQIAARFEKFGVHMTENNKRQAYLPDNAVVIENPVGTAPSFAVELPRNQAVISLPGVPREMKYLMLEKVVPYLREKYRITEQVILAKVLKTAGIGESLLDERIGNEILSHHNPTVGLNAHSGQIDMRITAKADTRTQAEAMIQEVETQIRARVGEHIFGVNQEKLEDAFAALLKAKGVSLVIAETGIGDVISQRLAPAMQAAGVPVETHQYASPEALGEAFQQPSESLKDLTNSTAHALLQSSGAQVVIAVVSRPDLDEESDLESGTAVVVATPTAQRRRQYGFGGKSAENVQQFAGNWSISIAWHMVKELLES
jgi:nicotinamide-nucleotide amidase